MVITWVVLGVLVAYGALVAYFLASEMAYDARGRR